MLIACFLAFQGKYVYIETSRPRRQGDKAKLEKSGLSFNTKKCLSFYYHMYGNTIGTLNVYVGSKKVFTKSDNQGNKWYNTSVDITEPGASTVRESIAVECLVICLERFTVECRK